MPATAESKTSQSDSKRTLDLNTLTQRLQATEMMLMVLGCSVPNPAGFVKALDALRNAVEMTVKSNPPEDSAEYLATLKRTRDFVEAIQEHRDARQ